MINYKFNASGFELNESIENYVKTRFDKLENRIGKFDPLIHVNLEVFKVNGTNAEIVIVLPYNIVLRADEKQDDLYKAIDFSLAKIEQQMRKYKTKINSKYKKNGVSSIEADDSVYMDNLFDSAETFEIVRNKSIDNAVMDPQEAILQMNLLGHDFFLFNDYNSGKSSVVYKRNNGKYGLISVE